MRGEGLPPALAAIARQCSPVALEAVNTKDSEHPPVLQLDKSRLAWASDCATTCVRNHCGCGVDSRDVLPLRRSCDGIDAEQEKDGVARWLAPAASSGYWPCRVALYIHTMRHHGSIVNGYFHALRRNARGLHASEAAGLLLTYIARRILPPRNITGRMFWPSWRSAGTPCTVSGRYFCNRSVGIPAADGAALHRASLPVQLALTHVRAYMELNFLGSAARLLFKGVCGSKGPGQRAGATCHELPQSMLIRTAEHGQFG